MTTGATAVTTMKMMTMGVVKIAPITTTTTILVSITRKKDSNDQEKLQNSMEKVEQLKTDNLCANEKILMLKEQLAK